MVPCSIEFFSRKNSKQPNVHGCIFGCDGIRAASELTSLSMLGREFVCCKLTALTGGQWFTAESSLQCKLEVKECTGRTFFNDDIRGGSECVPPCTRLNVEFASQTHCSDRIPVIPTAKVTHPYNRNAYTAAVFYRFYIYRISPPICKLNGESAQWTFPDRLDDIQHAAEFH